MIFREIKRNFWADYAFPKKCAGYFGHAAQLQTDKRRSVQRKLIRHPHLRKRVVERLKNGWTPEQIGNMFKPYDLDLIGFNEVPDGDWTARVGKVLGMKRIAVTAARQQNLKI